jgi:hypothetical protein
MLPELPYGVEHKWHWVTQEFQLGSLLQMRGGVVCCGDVGGAELDGRGDGVAVLAAVACLWVGEGEE